MPPTPMILIIHQVVLMQGVMNQEHMLMFGIKQPFRLLGNLLLKPPLLLVLVFKIQYWSPIR